MSPLPPQLTIKKAAIMNPWGPTHHAQSELAAYSNSLSIPKQPDPG